MRLTTLQKDSRNLHINKFTKKLRPKKCCPHCESTIFVKNGTFNNIQRYLCKNIACNKSFSDVTNTIFYYSKKAKENMQIFALLSSENLPLRPIAEFLNIALHTAFSWRHKLLNVYSASNNNNILSGTIEMKNIVFYENFKGQRNIEKSTRSRVDLIIPLDSQARSNPITVCPRYDKLLAFTEKFNRLISADSIIFTSETRYLKHFRKAHNPDEISESIDAPSKLAQMEISKTFKNWLKRFRGVSTKNLSNYTAWFILNCKLYNLI